MRSGQRIKTIAGKILMAQDLNSWQLFFRWLKAEILKLRETHMHIN